jgi:uncharacterized protein YhhL (DUF1145 family)
MRTLKTVILVPLALFLISTASLGQNPTDGSNIANLTPPFGAREWMTVLILVFGIIIVGIEYMLLKDRTEDKVEDLGKYLVITVIIIGTMALMVGTLDNNQTAPAVGLFGTIAGYLLGRSEKSRSDQEPAEESTKKSKTTNGTKTKEAADAETPA